MMNSQVINLIQAALEEDIGCGDVTTDCLIDADDIGSGVIIAREPLVAAGLEVGKQVFEQLDARVVFKALVQDGDAVVSGARMAEVRGKLRGLLKGERTALNFLQHLSGIATHVRTYKQKLEEFNINLVDTRKTTPGWRVLEKYAVRLGGAGNHRMGLFDGVLIKDNHIAACGGVKQCIQKIRQNVSHLLKIEVEVSNMVELEAALKAGADVIMLDNMNLQQITAARVQINGRALVEVSGGVNLQNIRELARTGVDLISVGALTHAARSMDISMKIK